MKLGHCPKFQKLHIYMCAFWKFQSHVTGSHLKENEKSSLKFNKRPLGLDELFESQHIHSLSIPGGRNWVHFRSMGSDSRDTGWLSKAMESYWLLAKVPEVAHTISFYPMGSKLSSLCSRGSGFRDRTSKLPYLGMKFGHWPKSKKLHIYSLSTQGGSKLSLHWLYGQRFLRYGPIFKIAIFGNEMWQLSKFPEIVHILPKLPQVPNLTPFCSKAGHFRDIVNA